ncbi:MAG: polysaccharide deacetylase family protein [Planctomycetota bacterium]|nr:polysaccharide deacetylase family protein [Planctomycetota bacterium]
MSWTFNLWPGGRPRCLTMSYDDGSVADRKLVEIFNRHGIRGSFHLNGGMLGGKNVTPEEIPALFAGHEVSAHGLTHPFLSKLPRQLVASEILEDRRRLEELVGYPVRGMSYPFGDWSADVVAQLPALGIEYARVVPSHRHYETPNDLLTWAPTCHHADPELIPLYKGFSVRSGTGTPALMYVWGHSYEFDLSNNWNLIEDFCRTAGGDPGTWYATNIEIADYLNAVRRLRMSVDGGTAFNPSAVSVWASVGRKPIEIAPGKTVVAPTP